ncbi:MAG: pirin-like C-terminal cupin domain-containing protein, partial [Pseudomonadota bacterium]
PSFSHTPASAIPQWREGAAQVRVLAGEAFGLRSPVPTVSPTLYLDIHLPDGAGLLLPPLAAEMAVYPVAGTLRVDGAPLAVGRMAVLEPGQPLQLEGEGDTRLAVVGGQPLDGPRHMWWNFVHSRPERVREAAADWEAGRFARIPGETEFIPLPEKRFQR